MNPNITVGVHVNVKFRAFGITFGTYSNSASLTYSLSGGFSVKITGATPPSSTTTVFNERGVLVQVWEAAAL